MTDDTDIPTLPDRIAAVYARGAGPWYEALAVLDTPLMPRWRWNELQRHRSAPGKTGCRLCARRPPRPTDASVDDCDPPDQLFVMPLPAGSLPLWTYCREHYAAHWARLLDLRVPT